MTAPSPKICPTCGTEYPADERFCPRDGSALRAQDGGTDLIGSIIAERYLVLSKLGEGGMGQVYLAEHVKMGRKSAVKVMNPRTMNDADAISRFNREAANASRISHQHVAQVYDFGETSDGLIYLAMEYVEGEPLTEILKRDGALPPERVGEIIRQAGEGLAVAHDMGIVHRDLKPDNLMLAQFRDGSDCVKIVDFGIAKANVEAQKVTKTGLVIGTPEFMSPEQIAGDPLDGRSDIYSLGLVAYTMLTGHMPFPSKTAQESVIMRLTEPPVRLARMRPEIAWTPGVQAVMDKALQREAALRYQSASEFGRELAAAVKGLTSVTRPGTTRVLPDPDGWVQPTRLAGVAASATGVAPAVKPRRVSRTTMVAAGVAVIAIAAVLVVISAQGKREADATTTEAGTIGPAARPVSDTGTGAPPASATRPGPDVAAPAPATSRPPGPTVTARAAGKSYGVELRTLGESITDSASAIDAMRQLSILQRQVTLASDSAAVQFVEAKATLLTGGAAKGCQLMRRIKARDLGAEWREDLSKGIQACEGN